MGKLRKNKVFIFFIVCFFLVASLTLYIWLLNKKVKSTFSTIEIGNEIFPKNPVLNAPVPYLDILEQINLNEYTNISQVSHSVYSGTGLMLTDQNNVFVSWLPESELIYKKGVKVKSLGDVLDLWSFEDLDNDNNKELTAQFAFAGTASVHPFYLYSYQNGEFKLLLKLSEARSSTQVIDLDNDGTKEIVYKYALSGSGNRERETLRWKDIWRLESGKAVKVNNQFSAEYKELIPIYDEALTTEENKDFYQFDYPVYRCLKEKAELNISGQFADAEDCRETYNDKYK